MAPLPMTMTKDGGIVLSAPHNWLLAGAPACGQSVQSSPCPHGGSRPSWPSRGWASGPRLAGAPSSCPYPHCQGNVASGQGLFILRQSPRANRPAAAQAQAATRRALAGSLIIHGDQASAMLPGLQWGGLHNRLVVWAAIMVPPEGRKGV